jgi:DNA-binding NarL/FixJ family response regulator
MGDELTVALLVDRWMDWAMAGAISIGSLDCVRARRRCVTNRIRRWRRRPRARIPVFSMHSDPIIAARALEAGVTGYVRKDTSPDELFSSSASASSVGGTVRPSALAVLTLMTNSTLVGCQTGRSAGLAPLRILPM